MNTQNSDTKPATIDNPDVIKKLRIHLAACNTPEQILSLLVAEFSPCTISLVDVQNAIGRDALRILETISGRKTKNPDKENRINELINLLKDDFDGYGGDTAPLIKKEKEQQVGDVDM